MENDSYQANKMPSKQEYETPPLIPEEILGKLSEPERGEIVRWDEARFREIEELRSRALQMEKTMKWWSECTANWREKWGKVRAERNKAREQCKTLQIKLEATLKDCSALRYDKGQIKQDYSVVLEELARLKGVPVAHLESKRRSRAENIDIDSSYAPSDEHTSEPSLKSELSFIEDVLKHSEEHYTTTTTSPRAASLCSEGLVATTLRNSFGWRDERVEPRRLSLQQPQSGGASCPDERYAAGVDLGKLKQLLEETQRHLHEEKNSKIALSQSAEMYSRENQALKKKLEDYKRQRSDALDEVSRIQLESGDKLARLSLEIEGESEGRVEMERKVKEMRTDIQRLQAENATEWARRERLETEKSTLERENKNFKLHIQELEETLARRNTNPTQSPEYKTLQTDVYERNKELEMLRTSHSRIKKQLAEKSGELEHCQKRLEVLDEEVYALRKRVEELKKELSTREDEVDMRNNQIRKLQRTLDECTEQNDTLQSQNSSLELRLRQRTDAMFNPAQRRGNGLSDAESEDE